MRLRQSALLLLLAAAALSGSQAGCIHRQLQLNTLQMADTVTELQSQQVLDNLAMFSVNEYALPAQVRIQDGSAQVSDQISPGGSLSWPPGAGATRGITLSGYRQWTQKWDVVPITDPNDLKRLRGLYRWAVGKMRYEDLHRLYEQINREEGRATATPPPSSAPSAKEGDTKPKPPLVLPKESDMPRLEITAASPFTRGLVGRHRGHWVRVTPERNFSEFLLLTLGATPETKVEGRGLMFQGTLLNPQ